MVRKQIRTINLNHFFILKYKFEVDVYSDMSVRNASLRASLIM